MKQWYTIFASSSFGRICASCSCKVKHCPITVYCFWKYTREHFHWTWTFKYICAPPVNWPGQSRPLREDLVSLLGEKSGSAKMWPEGEENQSWMLQDRDGGISNIASRPPGLERVPLTIMHWVFSWVFVWLLSLKELLVFSTCDNQPLLQRPFPKACWWALHRSLLQPTLCSSFSGLGLLCGTAVGSPLALQHV